MNSGLYFENKKHRKGINYIDVKKSGGTNFASVLRYVKEKKLTDVAAIIFLTDGGDESLSVPANLAYKPRCPILWIITDQNGMGDHLKWGRSILIEDKLKSKWSRNRAQANPRMKYRRVL